MIELKRGINLGGFLSQCEHKQEHYDTFIVEDDIKKIAEMGFDHVRLAVDYEIFEEEDGTSKPQGFARVAEVIGWAKKNNLNIVLDLHKAFGYDFNNAQKNDDNVLFSDPSVRQRFIDLWEKIAIRYSNNDHIVYELLNEVVEKENAQPWNELIDDTVKMIRGITKDIPIIYGGIQWNSVNTLKLLDKPKYDNIIYTFHFYEPLVFTHQKAYWVPTIDPQEDIFYPKDMKYFVEKSIPVGYQGEATVNAKALTMGVEFITEMIEAGIKAAKEAGVPLYCGEFGVIDQAPIEDTYRWFKDVDEVFCKYDIGSCLWTYKEMDFGLMDEHYAPIKEDLLKLWIK